MTTRVILRHGRTGAWLGFFQPDAILQSDRLSDVKDILKELDIHTRRKHRYAAGFLSYEAGPAFDPSFQSFPSSRKLPLIWFGLFKHPTLCSEFPLLGSHHQTPQWHSSMSFKNYKEILAQIKTHISRGNCYQVNYSFRLRCHQAIKPVGCFRQLLSHQNAPYTGFLATPAFAILSLSPELFFTLDNKTLISQPMKGTSVRSSQPEVDKQLAHRLQSSPKQQSENLMIVDMVRNDMSKVATTGSVKVLRLFELTKYPTLWQMTSTVHSQTNAPVSKIMEALFPAASITGAPKSRATQIIRQIEESPRAIYTGCLGFIGPNRTAQFNVAIRTMWLDRKRHQAEYGTGGGIVWESDARDEFQECWTKAKILMLEKRIIE